MCNCLPADEDFSTLQFSNVAEKTWIFPNFSDEACDTYISHFVIYVLLFLFYYFREVANAS